MLKNNVAAKLLPLIFSLTSFAVGCADPLSPSSSLSEQQEEETAAAEADTAAAEAVAKIPSSSMAKTPEMLPMPTETKSLEPMEISIPELKLTYPVTSFDFAIDNKMDLQASTTTGQAAPRAAFSALKVRVMPNQGAISLSKQLFSGTSLSKVVLQRAANVSTKTKASPVATFELVSVAKISSLVDSNSVEEEYELRFASLQLFLTSSDDPYRAPSWVAINVPTNTASLSAGLNCEYSSATPFVQAHESWPLPSGATAVDRFELAMSNEAPPNAATGGAAMAGRAKLDTLAFERTLDKNGLCAVAYAQSLRPIGTMTFQAATGLDSKGRAIIPHSWDSCTTFAKRVSFSGGGTEETREHVEFAAGGIVRTDTTFSPLDGTPLKPVVTGWSFINNKPVLSCNDVR